VRVRNAVWLAVLLIGVCPLLRADCNDVVWDQQHVLSNSDEQMLIQAAHSLVLGGASVHALTLDMGTASSLEGAVAAVQASCDSWQVPKGERKNNLLVFAVDTQRHKSGIFYGALYHRALDSTWHDVATQYMNPHFHDREYAAGLAEGMRQTRVLLMETLSTGKTVVQQFTPATDYTPFWKILGWIVIGLFAVLAGWFVAYALRRRAERQQQLSDAQADLQQAKNNATDDLDKAKQKLAEDVAIGAIATEQRQAILDRAYRTFTRIDAAENRGSSLAFIKSTADAYRAISESAQQCMVELPVRRVPRYAADFPHAKVPRHMAVEPNPSVPAAAPPSVPASNTTTVIHESSSGGDGLLTGMLLGDVLSRHDDERENLRRRDDDEEDRSSRSREDDSPSYTSDPGGGGSSDWSSSDSGGGGGSDFSSSDSGGGGSSDY
jgi:uncharacterized membrane protein YgcG